MQPNCYHAAVLCFEVMQQLASDMSDDGQEGHVAFAAKLEVANQHRL